MGGASPPIIYHLPLPLALPLALPLYVPLPLPLDLPLYVPLPLAMPLPLPLPLDGKMGLDPVRPIYIIVRLYHSTDLNLFNMNPTTTVNDSYRTGGMSEG